MLRVIDRAHRRPVIVMHRARPAEGEKTPGNARQIGDTILAEQKAAYINFIASLMCRMEMDGLERMLDAALEQEIN